MLQQKVDLEQRLKDTNIAIKQMIHSTLPDAMDSAGVSSLTLPPEGNTPAYKITVGPYFHANIAADWPEHKRNEAFKWLDDHGHGDLIKTVVSVAFARQERDAALDLLRTLEEMGHNPTLLNNVPWNTLTAWLREQFEQNTPPPLELIGATVGRVATLKKE